MRRMVAAAVVAVATIGAAPPAERVVTGDGIVAATVDGAAGRLRVDPGAPGLPLLTTAYAARAGLKGGGMLRFDVMYRIGPERVPGHTQVARLAIGDGADAVKRRVGWTARPFAAGVDATAGVMGVPEPVVRFQWREPRPGERTATLPMLIPGGMFGDWFGAYALVDVGGQPLRVRFSPYTAATHATAGAAVRVAAANGGTVGGAVAQAPIAFGIERPVRRLSLARPLGVGPLSLSAMMVRVADGGSTASLREEGTPDAAPDPDEVVVTAKGRHDPRRDVLTLGADMLGRCSSVTFDKPAKLVRLVCG